MLREIDLKKLNYFLVNAEEYNAKNPRFEIPSKQDIYSLQKWDYVKVCFNNKERMWLQILRIELPLKKIWGELANDPCTLECAMLMRGDVIEIEFKNIYAIHVIE